MNNCLREPCRIDIHDALGIVYLDHALADGAQNGILVALECQELLDLLPGAHALHAQDGNRDAIANDDSFPSLAAENQHVATLH